MTACACDFLDLPSNVPLAYPGYVRLINATSYGLQIASPNLAVTAGTDTTLRFVIADGGSVGIGTAAPLTTLHVAGLSGLHLQSSAGSPEGGRLTFFGDGTGWRLYLQARDNTGAQHPAGVPILTAVDTGQVGIGTATPAYPLDVAGSVHTGGSIIAGTRTVADGGGCYYA